jgi:hypothetical protein
MVSRERYKTSTILSSEGATLPYTKFGNLFKQLDKFVEELSGFDEDEIIRVGVGATGPAAEYAMVWEWGNVRQTKQGPKTVLGINPDGQQVWLTIQAPFGYIRVNTEKYWQIIYQEIGKVNFDRSGREIDAQIRNASNRISERILEVIRDTVPVDSGELRDALRVFTEAEMAS